MGCSSSPGWDSLLKPMLPDYVQLCADERASARRSAADSISCCAGALTATCRRCGKLTRAGCLSCAVPAREATAACWWSPPTMACCLGRTPPLQRTPFSMCPAAENPVRRALPKGTCLWGSHCHTRSASSRTECLGGGCVWDKHRLLDHSAMHYMLSRARLARQLPGSGGSFRATSPANCIFWAAAVCADPLRSVGYSGCPALPHCVLCMRANFHPRGWAERSLQHDC